MRPLRLSLLALVPALLCGPVRALDLTLPEQARMTHEVVTDPGSYLLPTGPFAEGALPVDEVDGRVVQQAWKIEQSGMTSLQALAPFLAQLDAAGYEILLNCGGPACGGFDFRFGTQVMAPPYLYIDMFDYRFVSARGGEEAVSVLTSQTGAAVYIQIIRVGPDVTGITRSGAGGGDAAPKARPRAPVTDSGGAPLTARLRADGHVILADLEFASGSADLGPRAYASLEDLAAFLKADPARRIALVGHTDAVGALDRNVALSRQRAQSVLTRLVDTYGVPPAQLVAEGVGFLAPIASSETPDGRETNRRVEAVLMAME